MKNIVKREPDFQNLIDVLERKVPSRRTLFEFFMDGGVLEKLASRRFSDYHTLDDHVQIWIDAFMNAGYDYITLLPTNFRVVDPSDTGGHATANKNASIIKTMEDCKSYKWRDPADYGYGVLDVYQKYLPKKMKLIVFSPDGILENATTLMGFESICYKMYDEPELVEAVFGEVCAELYKYYSLCVNHPAVGALMCNDDWGYRSSTMLPPDFYRRHVFPTYKKVVELAHSAGKKALLHSCGKLDTIFDDIIDDMKFDGKHSNEDTILPVEEAYKKYGRRIGIVGGIDLDFLCKKTPAEIRDRCEKMYGLTKKHGGYALGSGNSIPNYVPYENYLAMIRTALE